jgi:hypothetical protein
VYRTFLYVPKFCGNKNTRLPTGSDDAMLALCVNYIDQERLVMAHGNIDVLKLC